MVLLGWKSFGQTNTANCDTIYAANDDVTIDTTGAIIWPTTGTYSVLTNDNKYDCATNTFGPVIVSGSNQNAVFSVITPTGNNGAIIFNPANGNIAFQAPQFSAGSTYLLQYQICDLANPSICVSRNVTVTVVNVSPRPALEPAPIISPIAKPTQKPTTSFNNLQIIDFPDPVLKQRLLTYGVCYDLNLFDFTVDANGDNEIDTDEALNVGRINVSNYNITDLTGLIYFSNLKILGIAYTQITNINNSLLPNSLLEFGAYNIPITTLNPGYFPNLTKLYCNNTQINTLDAGGNYNLQVLNIQNTPNLNSLNIKNISSLDYNDFIMTGYCWTGCPNLTSICADSTEIGALQSYLASCGVSTAGIDINSNCALATDDYDVVSGVMVSPNPSSGVFTVSFSRPIDNGMLKVYNVLGQEVMRFLIPKNDNFAKFDLSNYPSGAYLVKITGDGGEVVKTVLKR